MAEHGTAPLGFRWGDWQPACLPAPPDSLTDTTGQPAASSATLPGPPVECHASHRANAPPTNSRAARLLRRLLGRFFFMPAVGLGYNCRLLTGKPRVTQGCRS